MPEVFKTPGDGVRVGAGAFPDDGEEAAAAAAKI